MDTIECTMDTILVPIVKPIVSIVVKSHPVNPVKNNPVNPVKNNPVNPV